MSIYTALFKWQLGKAPHSCLHSLYSLEKTENRHKDLKFMGKELTETVAELAQDCIGKCPVIILGSGASVDYDIPGMPKLKDQLLKVNCPKDASPEEKANWSQFQLKLGTTDLFRTLLHELVTRKARVQELELTA